MSNGSNLRTLTYDVADLPMLLHALRIGATTAMMCGHHTAKKHMDQYVALLKEAQLPGMELFEEEVFSELGAALALARGYEVVVKDPAWVSGHWRADHSVAVIIDGERIFFTDYQHMAAGEKLQANVERVRRLMADLAPLGVTEPETTA